MRLPISIAAVLLSACSLWAQAAPSQTAIQADDRLRAWLATDPQVHGKISAAQAPAGVPLLADPDLKDAVADVPSAEAARRDVVSRLPGMKSQRRLGCQDFETCDAPPLALDLAAGESIEAGIRALMRPWIWLADARGIRLAVTQSGASATPQAVLAMNLKELDLSGVSLNVEVRPEGGVHLWFSRGLELAALYGREREVLRAANPTKG